MVQKLIQERLFRAATCDFAYAATDMDFFTHVSLQAVDIDDDTDFISACLKSCYAATVHGLCV